MRLQFRVNNHDKVLDLPDDPADVRIRRPCPWDKSKDIQSMIGLDSVVHQLVDRDKQEAVQIIANRLEDILVPENKKVYCDYCGHEHPGGTPAQRNKQLTVHIFECPKHPLRPILVRIGALARLADEVSRDDPASIKSSLADAISGLVRTAEQLRKARP